MLIIIDIQFLSFLSSSNFILIIHLILFHLFTMSKQQVPSSSSRKLDLKRSEESLTKKSSEVRKLQAKSKSEAMTSKKIEKVQKKQSQQKSQGPEDSVKDYLTENQSELIAPAEDICENKNPNKKRKLNQNESHSGPAQLSKSRELQKKEIEKNPVLQEKTKKQRQKSHIKRLEQRAKIAQKVIRMIESPHQVSELEKEAWGNDPQVKKVKSYSLAERIKKALLKLNTNAQSRDDVLQLFTEGVVPPSQIFNQKRIQDAKTGPKKDKRFIYCPNSIISSQIFSIFSSDPPEQFINSNKYLLKGQKGISKTVSVSLLWHLTRFIDEYRLNSANIESKFKKTFNEPIIAYWSFLQDDTLQKVLQKLLQQLPHLKQKFNQKQIIQKKINIGEFYQEKYGVKVHLAIDQIHTLAKYFREIQSSIQKSGQNEQKIQEMDEIRNQMKLVKKISSKFDKTIYLSSMDIEQAFLKKCDLDCNGGHTIVDVREVEYARDMYKTEALTDLCHFYVFKINERVLKPSNLAASEQELRQAQQECIQILKERLADEKYFYMTFYSIFQKVNKIQLSNQGEKIQRADIKKFLTLKFQQAVKLLTQQAIDQFYAHFLKEDGQDDSRKYLILKLFFETEKIVDKQNSISFANRKQHLLQGPDYQIPFENLGLKNEKEAIGKLPLTFFSIPSSNQNVKLRLPAKLTSKMIKTKIAQSLTFYLNNSKEWMEKSTTIIGLAGNIERLLVFAIKNIETGFQLQYKRNNKKLIQSIAEKYSNIRKGSYRFQSLKTGGKQQSLLEKLKIPLQKMLDNKHQCTVLEPVTLNFVEKNFKDVNLHETSKAIDFIIARAQLFCGKKHFHLDLIDVTVENSLKAIEKKMNDFLKIFLSLKDKHQKSIKLKTDSQQIQYPVWLRYFIYCRKNQHPNLLNELRNTFEKSLKFEGQPDANYYEVKFLNKKQSFLYAVSFINIESDVTFQSNRQGDINVQSLKAVFEVLNIRKEMKE